MPRGRTSPPRRRSRTTASGSGSRSSRRCGLIAGKGFPFDVALVRAYWSYRKNTTDASGVEDYPDDQSIFLMWMQNLEDAWLNAEPGFKSLPGTVQGSINGKYPRSPISVFGLTTSGMIDLNRSPPVSGDDGVHTVHLPNAIHYRRGVCPFSPSISCLD